MTGIEFLKKATIADSLGKFKLADRYFNRAVRLAQAGKFTAAAIEALEKAGLAKAERELVESGAKTLAEVLEAQSLKAFEEALTGRADKLREMLKLTGKTPEEISVKMREFGALVGDARKDAMKELAAEIQAKNESLFKLEPGPGPGPGPGPVPPVPPPGKMDFSKLSEEAKKAFSTMGPFLSKIYLNGPKWLTFVKFLGTIGGGWQLYQGGIRFYNLFTNKDIPVKDIINGFGLFEGAKPSNETGEGPAGSSGATGSGGGSGETGSGAGGAGTPDPTIARGFQYKSKDDMYERRMKAKMPGGTFQQTLQGDAAQEYVNANKDTFKTQREFYDAAFAAKDKNFANSVIALVKKDLDLPVSAQDPRRF